MLAAILSSLRGGSSLPTLNLGAWRMPPGLYLSWGVARPLTELAFISGRLPPLQSFASPEAPIRAYWTFLAAAANIVSRAIVEGNSSEPTSAWRGKLSQSPAGPCLDRRGGLASDPKSGD